VLTYLRTMEFLHRDFVMPTLNDFEWTLPVGGPFGFTKGDPKSRTRSCHIQNQARMAWPEEFNYSPELVNDWAGRLSK